MKNEYLYVLLYAPNEIRKVNLITRFFIKNEDKELIFYAAKDKYGISIYSDTEAFEDKDQAEKVLSDRLKEEIKQLKLDQKNDNKNYDDKIKVAQKKLDRLEK